jgi:hypothetical protein
MLGPIRERSQVGHKVGATVKRRELGRSQQAILLILVYAVGFVVSWVLIRGFPKYAIVGWGNILLGIGLLLTRRWWINGSTSNEATVPRSSIRFVWPMVLGGFLVALGVFILVVAPR